jgi:hypothetical protein
MPAAKRADRLFDRLLERPFDIAMARNAASTGLA